MPSLYEMQASTSKVRVLRIEVRGGRRLEVEDLVAVEVPVHLYVNGLHYTTIMATPTMLGELALGYALGEGLLTLSNLSELKSVKVEENAVRLEVVGDVEVRIRAARAPRFVPTACGSLDDHLSLLDRLDKPLVSSEYAIRGEDALRMALELNRRSEVFRATGGVHSAALFQNGSLVAFAEDVGRHNAVDKVLGFGALSKVSFQRSVLLSSGRLGAEIVLKGARLGVPIVASLSAPTSSGLRAAKGTGITLLGFVRGWRLNVYSHPERIL